MDNMFLKKFFLLCSCCFLMFLTGCVRYDVGINFPHQNYGEIVQHITLGERLSTLSRGEVTKWLNSVRERALVLGGSARQLNERETIVTIPFSNGRDLVKKFNRFFDTDSSSQVDRDNDEELKILQLNSRIDLNQKNFFFVERNNLLLNVDLRGLGILSEQGNIIISPGSIVDIDVRLKGGLAGRDLSSTGTGITANREDNELVWVLKPGEINTIEAVFWTPSYLAIGTIVIILLTIVAYFLKYKQFPGAPEKGTGTRIETL